MTEDQEINAALADRVAIKINEAVHVGEASYENILCPRCGKQPSFMRETLEIAVRRATFHGERRSPEWDHSKAPAKWDFVPTGELGDGLIVSAPVLFFHGSVPCTECGELLNIDIEIETRLDGQPILSFRE